MKEQPKPISQSEAIKMAKDVLISSQARRAAHEALCGLSLAYAYGSQWAATGNGRDGGRQLLQLRTAIHANKTDVRIALNTIRSRLRKTIARLNPREILADVEPSSRASNDQVAAMVGKTYLDQQITRVRAVQKWRMANIWRCCLGSVILRRSFSEVGPGVVLRDVAGEPVNGRDGEPSTLRSFSYDWNVSPPYQFIRDPGMESPTFEDDPIIGHEQAKPDWWVKQYFPETVGMESKGTMGQLLQFQKTLSRATGQSFERGAESRTKGWLLSEWWIRDPNTESKNPWPLYMIALRDPYSGDDKDEVHPIFFGPNPFYELPLHHLWYEIEPGKQWGTGIPILAMPAQDFKNIAATSVLRVLLAQSGPKYLVQAGSLTEDVSAALSNRIDKPIIYNAGMQKPERLQPPPLDQNAAQVLAGAEGWMDEMLNQADVQRGQAVKRGEAAKAYAIRGERADEVIEDIAVEDELTLNELLYGTLVDSVKLDRVKVIKQKLGHEYTEAQIMSLKNQDVADSVSGVRVQQGTIKPPSRKEMQEEFSFALSNEMVDPATARRSMMVRGRMTFDEKEKRAFRKQELETAAILNGETIDVAFSQDHSTHQYQISLLTEDPRWDQFTEKQREDIMAHHTLHDEAMQQSQMQAQGMAQPQEMPMQGEPEIPGIPGMSPEASPLQSPLTPGSAGMSVGMPGQIQEPIDSMPMPADMLAGVA